MSADSDTRNNESKESLGEYFSETSGFWEDVYEKNPEKINFYHLQMQSRRDFTIEYILEEKEDRKLKVLDVGSGPGTMMDERLQHHCEMVLLDISKDMIRKARLKMEYMPAITAVYTQGDVTALPFREGYFDIVTGLGLIEYVKDEDTAFNEIKRVLKPGGMAILSFPNALKIGNIFDPYFVFLRVPGYLWFKGTRQVKIDTSRTELYSRNRYFSNRRYLLSRLRNKIQKRGLSIEGYKSIGFGPLKIWRKEFLPYVVSVHMYRSMEWASRKPFGGWLNYVGNRWVFCLRKAL